MIEYFEDDANEFRYRIKGGNGEPLVTSEGYTTMESAERGVRDLRRQLVPESTLDDLTELAAVLREGEFYSNYDEGWAMIGKLERHLAVLRGDVPPSTEELPGLAGS